MINKRDNKLVEIMVVIKEQQKSIVFKVKVDSVGS